MKLLQIALLWLVAAMSAQAGELMDSMPAAGDAATYLGMALDTGGSLFAPSDAFPAVPFFVSLLFIVPAIISVLKLMAERRPDHMAH